MWRDCSARCCELQGRAAITAGAVNSRSQREDVVLLQVGNDFVREVIDSLGVRVEHQFGFLRRFVRDRRCR